MEALLTEKKIESNQENKSEIKPLLLGKKLGSPHFKRAYGLNYAYVTGAMYRGIASKELVVKMGQSGMLGFLGTGGMEFDQIRSDVEFIQSALVDGQAYGMNLIANIANPQKEMDTVELFLEKGIKNIEASAFMQVTPAVVLYRLRGLVKSSNGVISSHHRVMAKVSHPEVAKAFMNPAPDRILELLLAKGKITSEQAALGKTITVASDICVEADSGGHTDQGISTVLLPAIHSLRDQLNLSQEEISVGLAGGIGTPGAIAAAFAMGADFVVTGSINQCTVEADTSDVVKDLLEGINVHDTAYAPAGDMFEIGAKVQVLKKGLFFPARANRLYSLYTHYDSLEAIPEKIRDQIEKKYFKRSFDSIWEEIQGYLIKNEKRDELERAERNGKFKMSLVFRWYFRYSNIITFSGDRDKQVDYQIHTGPALGAFNQWVKGSEWESWRKRHVDLMAIKLMDEAAVVLTKRLKTLLEN